MFSIGEAIELVTRVGGVITEWLITSSPGRPVFGNQDNQQRWVNCRRVKVAARRGEHDSGRAGAWPGSVWGDTPCAAPERPTRTPVGMFSPRVTRSSRGFSRSPHHQHIAARDHPAVPSLIPSGLPEDSPVPGTSDGPGATAGASTHRHDLVDGMPLDTASIPFVVAAWKSRSCNSITVLREL